MYEVTLVNILLIRARILAVRIHVCNRSHVRIDEFGADI